MNEKRNKYIAKISLIVGESDPVRAATKFVDRFRRPGDTLEATVRNLGVTEIIEKALPFEGGIFEEGGSVVVKLNSLSPRLRQRFTLAHEIGHLMLTATEIGGKSCANDRGLEDACDGLAAELLMPAEETILFAKQQGICSPEALTSIAGAFDVSLQMAARRLHQDLRVWRQSVGLWKFSKVAEEVWFVGYRPWKQRRLMWNTFECAANSSAPVQAKESYFDGYREKAVYLEVLNIGNGRLLALVA